MGPAARALGLVLCGIGSAVGSRVVERRDGGNDRARCLGQAAQPLTAALVDLRGEIRLSRELPIAAQTHLPCAQQADGDPPPAAQRRLIELDEPLVQLRPAQGLRVCPFPHPDLGAGTAAPSSPRSRSRKGIGLGAPLTFRKVQPANGAL